MTRAHLKLLPLAIIWHLTRSVRLCYALAYRSTMAETRRTFRQASVTRSLADIQAAYQGLFAPAGPGCHQRALMERQGGTFRLTFTHCHFMQVGAGFRIPPAVMKALCHADRDFWSRLRDDTFAFRKAERTICDGESTCALEFEQHTAAGAAAAQPVAVA